MNKFIELSLWLSATALILIIENIFVEKWLLKKNEW